MKYQTLKVAYSIDNILYIETIKYVTEKTVINVIAEKHQRSRTCINIIGIEVIN